MQHRQKEETVVMVLGCSQRVQVSKWEEIWWVYNDEMSTLSLMINDQRSSQFHCFTKSLFWGGFFVQGIFHATLALGSWCDRWKVFTRKSIYVWYRCQTGHFLLITTRFCLRAIGTGNVKSGMGKRRLPSASSWLAQITRWRPGS